MHCGRDNFDIEFCVYIFVLEFPGLKRVTFTKCLSTPYMCIVNVDKIWNVAV